MLDAQSEKALTQFTQELRHLLADELVAVALYGSGAGENFVFGRKDLNIVIIVREVRFAVLQKLQPRIAAWHKLGLALPLLLDREFLQRSRDVFPMELYDIQEQHRLLWGEDVFRAVVVDGRHLRFQAEHEARSKLLRLQALYLECAGDRTRLRALMLDSLKTFLILMRTLIRLQGISGLLAYREVLGQFEQHFQCSFPRMHQLLAIRTHEQDWPAGAVEDFFRDYLTEVQRLVGIIDHLPSAAVPVHDQSA